MSCAPPPAAAHALLGHCAGNARCSQVTEEVTAQSEAARGGARVWTRGIVEARTLRAVEVTTVLLRSKAVCQTVQAVLPHLCLCFLHPCAGLPAADSERPDATQAQHDADAQDVAGGAAVQDIWSQAFTAVSQRCHRARRGDDRQTDKRNGWSVCSKGTHR